MKALPEWLIILGFVFAGLLLISGVSGLLGIKKFSSPGILWRQLASWLFWKRYSPNLSYNVAEIHSFDNHGFLGFSAKFTLTITNKNKPLKIDLTGVCLIIIQDGKYTSIGNSGLGIEDLPQNKSKTWKDIKVVTSPPQLVGVISNPPDLSKHYDTGIKGIYITHKKFRRELQLYKT